MSECMGQAINHFDFFICYIFLTLRLDRRQDEVGGKIRMW